LLPINVVCKQSVPNTKFAKWKTMEASNTNELEVKLEIATVAADLYVEQDGNFTISEIADVLSMDVADIFDYFPNKPAILEFYYTSLILRYRLMIQEIKDFDSYTLSEKLSNFIYASLDLLNEKQKFVEKSFDSIVRHSYTTTPFEKEAQRVLTEFFEKDPNISTSNRMLVNKIFLKLMLQKYLYLIGYWLRDNSEGKERTLELVDKLTAFIQELMYNRIADRGFELGKFLVTNTSCSVPFWEKLKSKIEIR